MQSPEYGQPWGQWPKIEPAPRPLTFAGVGAEALRIYNGQLEQGETGNPELLRLAREAIRNIQLPPGVENGDITY